MKLSAADLEHLATLSRLELRSEDKEKLADQISAILGYVSEINDLDITGEPSQEKEHINIMRGDEATRITSLSHTESILQNAPNRAENYVKVSQVIKQ